MSKSAIKVSIVGRTYPLNVSEDEKSAVMKAAEEINRAVEYLRKHYAVNDAQDLLAMSSLQLLAKYSKTSKVEKGNVDDQELNEQLASLKDSLQSLL
ncbi:MAG: cell division protein ZapA [Bacteroidetes bacterium]|nr:cell division protein ZapA [Bacteroidota bacterium]